MKWKCSPIGKKNVYKNVVNEYITYQKPSCSRWAWTLVGLVSCTFSLIARSLSWTLSVGRWRCPRLPFLITRCVSLSFFSLKVWRFSSRWKKAIEILHKNQTHLRRKRWRWRTERGRRRRRLVCYCCCFCCFSRFFPTRRFTFRRPLMVRFLFKFPREEENRNKFRLRRRREGNRADSRARSDFNLFWRRRVVASFILTLRF